MEDASQLLASTALSTGSPSRSTVRVEAVVVATAASVLDQYAALQADARQVRLAGAVAHGLRAAVADAGTTPSAEQSLSAEAAAGRLDRPGRDWLAARVGDLFDHRGPDACRVHVATGLVSDAVALLQHAGRRFEDEPLGTAARRLWEHLYLCLPLTALACRPETDSR
ncbi:hypothetical protein AB0442_37585 [Kitasatospora sp. NPDC085895]|uniref:hypothetical protein n=1 Tax=Kitasatospora sp. NPDC085895 TaxID=3155057 RepID=UPI003450A5B8